METRALTEREKRHYLEEIRLDMEYFGRFYGKADYRVYVGGVSVDEVVTKIRGLLGLDE